ncbi:MAG: hypothetical protein FJW36_12765 [Acidobacteria bacterium]|nr:hypothetical protein [Acidobacteriota bacterium]
MIKSIPASPSTSIRLLTGLLLFGALSSLHTQVEDSVYFRFSQDSGWSMGNDQFRARFRMDADSTFRWVDLADSSGYTLWEASPAEPSSPIDVRIDNTTFNARSPLRFLNQQPFPVKNGGKGLALVFHDPADQFEFVLRFEIHPGHPVLHH